MKIQKAVITAAGLNQHTFPLHMLIDRDGCEKSVLRIILDEVRSANVGEVCVVIAPGDKASYRQAAGDDSIQFVEQQEPLGYGHALYTARGFVGDSAFLHLVGDHLYVGANGQSSAKKVVKLAEEESCCVSAVQATRETLLGRYGTVGARRIAGAEDVYRVERVIEKPTPTEAEQNLIVSGLRAGHYLCFFGMHVLTPSVIETLGRQLESGPARLNLSRALDELATREQYLALEQTSRRYDVGAKYGLLHAQLALGLSGRERNEVLAQLLELVALSTTEAKEIGQGA
jgi:UTP--glucose-1-phosphate uridylyltransferase